MTDHNSTAGLTGQWSGTYTYGDGYPDEIQGIPLPFVLDISLHNGSLTGTCTETEDNGTVLTSEVTGFIEDDFISFVKRYLNLVQLNEFGEQEPPLPDIHYTGQLLDGVCSGEWEMEWQALDEDGFGVEYLTQGTWQMGRTA